MTKPNKIYKLEREEEIFAIEIIDGDNKWTLLMQPPFGNFKDLSDAFCKWQEWGCEVQHIEEEYLDFDVDEIYQTYLDTENNDE